MILILFGLVLFGNRTRVKESLARVSASLDAYHAQSGDAGDNAGYVQLYEQEQEDFAAFSERLLNNTSIQYRRSVTVDGEPCLPPNAYERVYERGADHSVEYHSSFVDVPLFRRVQQSDGVYLADLEAGEYSRLDRGEEAIFRLGSAATHTLLSVCVAVEDGKVYTAYEVLESGQIVTWYVDDENLEIIRRFSMNGRIYDCRYTELQFDVDSEAVFEIGVRSEQHHYDMDDVTAALTKDVLIAYTPADEDELE